MKTAKLALPRNGYARQQDLAEKLGLARSTISNFLNAKSVDYLNFLEICRELQLELQEVADFSGKEPYVTDDIASEFANENNGENIDSKLLYQTLICLN